MWVSVMKPSYLPEGFAALIGALMIVFEEVLRVTAHTDPSPVMIGPAVTLILGSSAAAFIKKRSNGANGGPSGPPPRSDA